MVAETRVGAVASVNEAAIPLMAEIDEIPFMAERSARASPLT
jgi:hypothetical protein